MGDDILGIICEFFEFLKETIDKKKVINIKSDDEIEKWG